MHTQLFIICSDVIFELICHIQLACVGCRISKTTGTCNTKWVVEHGLCDPVAKCGWLANQKLCSAGLNLPFVIMLLSYVHL